MSLVTNPFVIWLRNTLRAAGLTRPLSMLRRSRNYEESVDRALFDSVRPGDVVWDVGANVGHYTTKLADRVGERGLVIAFEPSPVNLDRLRAATQTHPNIAVMPVGLSSAERGASFIQGEDQIGATSRLVRNGGPAVHPCTMIEIELRRGDALVVSGAAPQPNFIKVDVEGHELEVLEGLEEVLASSRLRGLIVEVHFGLLADAGRPDAPACIERLLDRTGFACRWIDASHLQATRKSQAV